MENTTSQEPVIPTNKNDEINIEEEDKNYEINIEEEEDAESSGQQGKTRRTGCNRSKIYQKQEVHAGSELLSSCCGFGLFNHTFKILFHPQRCKRMAFNLASVFGFYPLTCPYFLPIFYTQIHRPKTFY
ncbi:hypothetical protein HN873_048833 [Arachis hypogaea]